MIVKKVTKREDYVRFSIELEIETEGLKVVTEVYGGIIEKVIKGVRIQFLEDPDPNHEFYLLGQRTDLKEFKILYDRLFKGTYSDLEEKLNKLSIETVAKMYPYEASNISLSDKLLLSRSIIKDAKIIVSKESYKYYQGCYELIYILNSVEGIDEIKNVLFINKDGNRVYGVLTMEMQRAMAQLANMIDN